MPITPIQAEILRVIAQNRGPESYLAGATVLHRHEDTPRFSQDVDLFHDLAENVAASAEADAEVLRGHGYDFRWTMKTPSFYRAVVVAKETSLKIEWAQDTAFRFFPVQPDPFCGFRLHDADAATNKILALAGRTEVRDYIDTLYLHRNYLPLGALAWAACGKDPGYTPEFLLDQCNRHSSYTQMDINMLDLNDQISIQDLKRQWVSALDDAKKLVENLPASELGCLYLDQNNQPSTPDLPINKDNKFISHYGSVGGAWPNITDHNYPSR